MLIACKVLHALELLLFFISCLACFIIANTAGLFPSLTAQHTIAESSHSSSLCPFHICLVLSDDACMQILQPCMTLHLSALVDGQYDPCSAAARGCDIKPLLWSYSGVLLVSHMPTVITTGGELPPGKECVALLHETTACIFAELKDSYSLNVYLCSLLCSV